MKISKLPANGLHLSYPKIITNLLKQHDTDEANSTSVPDVKSSDLSKKRANANTVYVKKYQRFVRDTLILSVPMGTLRFIADTTHPGLTYIVGILGRHLHDPTERQIDAIKPI